jgi:PEP-CTERM motif
MRRIVTLGGCGRPRRFLAAVLGLILAFGMVPAAQADAIPYPNPGHYNPVTYSFTAATTGDVIGYFAGTDAAYDNKVGLLDNGVLTAAGYGLDDHTSSIGQASDFGRVTVGDSLVFVLDIITLGSFVYSDPTLNVAYDSPGETVGHNHVYATPYTATSPVFKGVPPGMYLAFEDESFPNSDYSYADENFVFTNVVIASVPEPASLMMLGTGLAAIASLELRRCKAAKAAK